jgi:ribosome maturation factor RimP
MISKKSIEAFIADKLSEADYFVVSLDVSSTNKIKLVVDKMQGITIQECVAFSRAIEQNLDREVEDFELEVTSPGLSSTLLVKQQYVKNIGRELDILLTDGKKIKGLLVAVHDDSIEVHEEKRVKVEGKKKKQLIKEERSIDFKDVKSALIVLKF